jgi:beta-mannosidase
MFKIPRLCFAFLFLCLLVIGVRPAAAKSIEWVDLGGAWRVGMEGSPETIPATVPGCIHTDLMAAGKIPDPFFGENESLVQWVGETNWIYRRSFDVAPEVLSREHVLLRCEGLDTLATVTLDGDVIGRTDNMFRTYEFDVKKLLKPGANTIEIKFDSAVQFVRAKEAQRPLPTWASPGAAYLRKEPCSFGWDWGPTLPSCGIWKKIGLVAFDAARLDDVAILQDHSQKGKVTLGITVDAGPATSANLKAKISVRLGTREVASRVAALTDGGGKADLVITHPQLWWPNGMGAHPLYTVAVDLMDENGGVLDSTTKRVGLRTLRAIQQTDSSPMHFVVNGRPFFAKGADWIPCDAFATRVTPEQLRRYMEGAVAANMNTLRLWGGGYYEEDQLYDLCDELGLCLWVDFKFACSTYPAFDPAFLDNVKVEAEQNVKRLRHHASIAVWCGNNEIMFFRGTNGWTDKFMSADDYYKLFRDTIGDVVRRLAPESDYVTGSPDCGDVHYWEVWHGGKPFEAYENIHGFVSEFGFQSFPEPKTVRAFTRPEDRKSVESHTMKYHERSNRMYLDAKEDGTIGTGKIMILVRRYFQEAKDFDSTLWLSQITQAYGIEYGAEGWRREMPKSMGCVFWQYNDDWPGSSWSSVDYFGRWKALQYAAKRFYSPVLVSGVADAKSGKVDLYVTSDRVDDCHGKLRWRLTTVAGEKIKSGSDNVAIPNNKSEVVKSLELQDELSKHGTNNVLLWLNLDIDGKAASENLVMFAYPKELPLMDPALTSSVSEKNGDFTVKIKAKHPALWVWLELADTDARFSDNFVHLNGGSTTEITAHLEKPMTREAFQKALRVRSLFDTYAH